MDHYRAVRRVHGKVDEDSFWHTVIHPNGLYCFPLRQFLEPNGRLKEHPLYGTKWVKTNGKQADSNKVYVIDNVCVHWAKGYYYAVTLRDENDSHACATVENINSTCEITLEGISRFNTNWKEWKEKN